MPDPTPHPPAPDDDRGSHVAGIAALESGDFARARDLLAAAVKQKPRSGAALLALATAQLGLGETAAAGESFNRSLANAGGGWPLYRNFGLLACERGCDDLAVASLEEAARLAPESAAVRNSLAAQHLKMGRTLEAEAAWQACLDIDPHYHLARRGLAQTAEAGGRLSEALALHEAAALSDSSPFSWQRDFIRILTDIRGKDGAVAHLRSLAGQHAGNTRLLRLLARTAAAAGKSDVETHAWTTLIEGDPTAYDAVIGLARIADRDGDDEALDRLAAKALQLEPHNAEALYLAGLAAHRRGFPEAARELLARSVTINPGYRWAAFLLATLQEAGSDLPGAIATIESFLAVTPGDGAALQMLANVLRRGGRPADAAVALQEAIAANPGDLSLRIAAVNELPRLGSAPSAWEEAQALVKEFPASGRARAALARLEMLAGRHTDALAHYRAATDLEPANVHIAGQLVTILNRLGLHQEALQVVARICELAGETPETFAMRTSTLLHQGSISAAEQTATTGLDRFPESVAVISAAWRLHLAAGFPERVLAAPDAGGQRSARERATLQSLRAEAAAQTWDIKSALRHLADVSLTPDMPAEFHRRIAWLSLVSCDIERARAHIDLALAAERHELQMRGANTRPLRSLLGSLYSDYRIDLQALSAVCDALDDVPRLMTIVREYPDYTGAALALLIALRRRGFFDTGPGVAGRQSIPRRIMQFWDSAEVPEQVLVLGRTWVECNPGFTYQRYSYADAKDFVSSHFGAPTLKALRRARNPAHKSDIFRLAWLLARGGVYADADDRCLAPIAPLIEDGVSLVCCQEYLGSIGNSFIAAAPGHPVIAAYLEEATAAILRNDNESIWLSTGPGLFSRVFARMMVEGPEGPERFMTDKRVIDGRQFRRFVSGHRPLPYKSTGSSWQNAEQAGR